MDRNATRSHTLLNPWYKGNQSKEQEQEDNHNEKNSVKEFRGGDSQFSRPLQSGPFITQTTLERYF